VLLALFTPFLLLSLVLPSRIAFDDIRQLATAALSAADVVRRTTLRRLRETFGHHTKLQVGLLALLLARLPALLHALSSVPWHERGTAVGISSDVQWQDSKLANAPHSAHTLCLPTLYRVVSCCVVLCHAVSLQDLDFSAVIAPKAEAVFDELADILAPYYMGTNAPLAAEDSEADEAADPEGDGSSSSMSAAARAGGVFARLGPALEQLQKYVAKAALLLWLWFDQQCEAMAEEVSWGAGPDGKQATPTRVAQ
jgi:hypothetical protein